MRPHLDYGNTVYDQVFNESFHKNLKSIQYNTAIAITGAIRATSSGRLRIRLRILKIEKLVNKIKIISQNHEKSLSFSANCTKQYYLCYKKLSKQHNLEF